MKRPDKKDVFYVSIILFLLSCLIIITVHDNKLEKQIDARDAIIKELAFKTE